jgi:hypothetical protein
MRDTVSRFLASLRPDQRGQAILPFKSDERFEWDYRPQEDRRGLPLKDMDSSQQKFAFALLSSGLSSRANAQVLGIMGLEKVLGEIEKEVGRHRRDPDLYYFTVFGNPSDSAPWGWRVEGHHVSLNFTITAGGEIAVTPHFLGANPAEVPEGQMEGIRLLAAEEHFARDLFHRLSGVQREQALISTEAPADIITRWDQRVRLDAPDGVPASEMTEDQRELLMKLVMEYTSRMPEDVADDRFNRLCKEGERYIHFAWAGSGLPGEPHYYRLQGPSFLVEYDNTQNDANHIHTVWRDVGGDWGDDLLREHYGRSHGLERGEGFARGG